MGEVMAGEFFRPYFSNGVWAQGELTPGLWYSANLMNNLSALGVKATQMDRKLSAGASVWWMPTTREFGPRGAYGDWERHEEVATRFGISTTFSPEERYTDAVTGATGNTTVRLADSLDVFDAGATAELINRYPDRWLFGTDEAAPTEQEKYLKVYDLCAPLFAKLTPEARQKVLKGNHERLVDEARRRVRAWEKANVK